MAQTRARPSRKRPRAEEEGHILDTVDRLKAMADPVRIRFILELGEGPRTVKEVAEAIDVPPTRLYYHVKILERHGLIQVANRRMVSGIEERSYRAAAENWSISPMIAASALYETGALRALFDVVRAEIEVALQGSPDLAVEDPRSPLKAMAISEFAISPEELPKLLRDFGKFLAKYGERPRDVPEQERYRMFYAMYPVPTTPPSADAE